MRLELNLTRKFDNSARENATPKCAQCSKAVFKMEEVSALGMLGDVMYFLCRS
jgi:hypothetical protein